MLGSLEHAKSLALIVATGADPEENGFAYAGQGAYRNAYLGPDGNIYKVDRNKAAGKQMTGYNYSEWVGLVNSLDLISLPISHNRVARFALSQMYQVGSWFILCQEYVPNSSTYSEPLDYSEYRSIQDWFGITDLHGGNYRVDDEGNIVIVDAGFNSSHDEAGKYVPCDACGVDHYCTGSHKENKLADTMLIGWAKAAASMVD